MRSSVVSGLHSVALVVLMSVLGCGGGGGGHGSGTPTPIPPATPTPASTATPSPGPTPSAVPNPFTIAAGVSPDTSPAAAFAAGRYLTTFSLPGAGGRRDVYGVRLASGGGAIDDAPVLLSDLGEASFLDAGAVYQGSAIGVDGSGFGVFFAGLGRIRSSGAPGQMIGFAALPPAGPPLRPATEVDTQASFGMAQTVIAGVAAASSVGSRLVGLYRRASSMIGFPFVIGQLDAAEVVVDGGGAEVRSRSVLAGGNAVDGEVDSASSGGISSDGTTALAAWLQVAIDVSPPGPPHVTSTRLDGALLTATGTTSVGLAEIDAEPGDTVVGSDGADFLVVWSDRTLDAPSPPNEIRALRFRPGSGADSGGVVTPPGGFLVADGSAAKSLVGVAFAGGTYLVVWLEEGILRGARIAEDATTATPFTVDPDPVNAAALTTDGERFLVVIEKPRASTVDLIGLLVDPTA